MYSVLCMYVYYVMIYTLKDYVRHLTSRERRENRKNIYTIYIEICLFICMLYMLILGLENPTLTCRCIFFSGLLEFKHGYIFTEN